ncbi:MAG: adenine deaminase [Bacteroidota bacterium]
MTLSGQIVDIIKQRIYPGEILIEEGNIIKLTHLESAPPHYLLPGFIDAHVHVESSMLTPAAFGRKAVCHGTIATVSDPHEIANVLGVEGVEYMIENGKKIPFKFYFGAPSCVPATSFETAGAHLGPKQIEDLLDRKEIYYLAEMMNYPGVLHKDPEVMEKLKLAREANKPIDGHAPGLRGDAAATYTHAGISTDHEAFTYQEAREKLELGMKILIREGSAAKNFEALIDLLPIYPDHIMFCSDDKHPDDLMEGHINQLVKRALDREIDLFQVLRAASLNPKLHYGLETGLLQEGDSADFILVKDLKSLEIIETYIEGQCVFEHGVSRIPMVEADVINQFKADTFSPEAFTVQDEGKRIRVIEAIEGELITKSGFYQPKVLAGKILSDTEKDILKITVVNRYEKAPPAVAFIKNFGLQRGAIASSVAHDSHNVIAVGVEDEALTEAVNAVIAHHGGIAVYDGEHTEVLPLPIGGLMSPDSAETVSQQYQQLNQVVKEIGSPLHAPFMTLSFMALLVIPSLKLSDKGLFDGDKFEFVSLFEE